MISEDGRWQWDGQRWVPRAVETEVVIYGGMFSPARKFQKDARCRSAEGWHVQSQSEQPRAAFRSMPPKLVVTYWREGRT